MDEATVAVNGFCLATAASSCEGLEEAEDTSIEDLEATAVEAIIIPEAEAAEEVGGTMRLGGGSFSSVIMLQLESVLRMWRMSEASSWDVEWERFRIRPRLGG